jgi:hypothetical protein
MDNRKPKFGAGSPLSWILFHNLRNIYFTELKNGLSKNVSRNKIHVNTQQGITAFPIAVAVWESILNEMFFPDLIKYDYNGNLLFEISSEAEKWDLKTKTLMFPKFLFGRTFDNSTHVFANFQTIIQIRNNIIHYKHSLFEGPDKALKYLRNIKVSYPKPEDVGCPWHMELGSTECVRFCVNTISALVKELSGLETEYYKKQCIPITTEIYKEISDKDVDTIFEEFKISTESINNDMFGNNKN